MTAIQVEGIAFLSIFWLYWAEGVEPISLDSVSCLGNIALPSVMPPTEMKGIAV